MKCRLPVAVAICAALGVSYAVAQDREVVLNYSDPHGVDLAVALIPHVEDLPSWMREIGDAAVSDGHDVTLTLQGGAGGSGSSYVVTAPRLDRDDRSARPDASTFELDPATGKPIEVRGGTSGLRSSATCAPSGKPSGDCNFSRPATEVFLLLARSASKNQAGLRTLVNEGGLAFDDRSAKRVVVRLDGDGRVEEVDFIGVLRGRQEDLAPPDATSANALRLHKDGQYEIVKRAPDTRVNLNDVNFGFEGPK